MSDLVNTNTIDLNSYSTGLNFILQKAFRKNYPISNESNKYFNIFNTFLTPFAEVRYGVAPPVGETWDDSSKVTSPWSPNRPQLESDSGVKTKLGHNGMDFDGEIGDRINSVKLGKVEEKGYDKGYGNYLVIRHKDGTKALYAHLSKFFVDEGSPVFAGMKIAEMGNTGKVVSESGGDGSHLHFGYDGNRDGRFSSNNRSDNPAALLFGGEF